MKRADEKPGITEVAASTGTQPTVHLSLERLLPPGWLLLQSLKRAEVSLRTKQGLDREASRGTDELVFQVLDTHEETQLFHLSTILWRADAPGGQSSPNMLLFAGVTQANDVEVGPLRAEPEEMASNCLGPADGHDDDSLCSEVSPPATGQRFECNLIADPLDQHDNPSRFRPRNCGSRRLNRRIRTADVAIQGFSGESTASLTVHERCISRCPSRSA